MMQECYPFLFFYNCFSVKKNDFQVFNYGKFVRRLTLPSQKVFSIWTNELMYVCTSFFQLRSLTEQITGRRIERLRADIQQLHLHRHSIARGILRDLLFICWE